MMPFAHAIQAALALLCPDWADHPTNEAFHPLEIHEKGYSAKEGIGDSKDCKVPIEDLELLNPLDRLHMLPVVPFPPPRLNPRVVTEVNPGGIID